MDTEIRDALARSFPDLAMIVRRDGVILSCVGGNAVRGLTAPEEEIPGRSVHDLWPDQMATHVLQTVRRILKTRKPAQQRYQDGDLKLEMRFHVQGFDRVLVVCRDLGAGATSNDSGLYEKSAGVMLPHRDGFEKSLRMALDMAALREDTVGVVLIHIGGYVTYQRVFDSALANRLLEAAAKVVVENLPEGRSNLPRLARVSDDVIGVVLTDIRSRADADSVINAMMKALKHPVDLDGQIFQLAPQAGVTLSGTDGARASELIEQLRNGDRTSHLEWRRRLRHAHRLQRHWLLARAHPGSQRLRCALRKHGAWLQRGDSDDRRQLRRGDARGPGVAQELQRHTHVFGAIPPHGTVEGWSLGR